MRARVTMIQATGEDAAAASSGQGFDAVCCHGVLMYQSHAEPLLKALCDRLAPGGVLSVMALNAHALAVRPALERRWAEASAAFDAGGELGVLGVATRADTVEDLSRRISGHGVAPVAWYGVWLFADWLDLDDAKEDEVRALAQVEFPRRPHRPLPPAEQGVPHGRPSHLTDAPAPAKATRCHRPLPKVPAARQERDSGPGRSRALCATALAYSKPERVRRKGASGERSAVSSYVLGFEEIDRTQVAVVGGKGAHLGELSRIKGVRVPAGFCVTTDAFRRIVSELPSIGERLDRLSRLGWDDAEAIRTLSAEIRGSLEEATIPDDLAAAITRSLTLLGERASYAVRSSATAEDLPTASFAGQQDTFLNVVGSAAILGTSADAGPPCSPSGPSPTACATASTTGRSAWPWSCSRWSSRRRPASCSRPTPSPPTGRSSPWRLASASGKPWSRAG